MISLIKNDYSKYFLLILFVLYKVKRVKKYYMEMG